MKEEDEEEYEEDEDEEKESKGMIHNRKNYQPQAAVPPEKLLVPQLIKKCPYFMDSSSLRSQAPAY